MKKRLLIGFLSFMMMFGITTQAFAQGGTFEIKEAEMTLDIPEEFVVFERIVDEFDPNLELINSTKAQLEEVFEQGNIYLNAVMVPPDNEIVVTLTENAGSQDIFNFKYFSEKEMDTLGSKLVNDAQENSNGVDYTGYETYKTDQGSFIVLDLIQNSSAGQVYGKQYYTIVNGQAIYITLHSYSGEISEDTSEMFKGIIDSVKFEEILEKPSEGLIEKITGMITIKTLAIAGGAVVVIAIILIIVGLRKNHDDEDEEAFDKYDEEDDEYECEDAEENHQEDEEKDLKL